MNRYTSSSMKSIGRPPGYIYKRAQLHADGFPLRELAERHGTPLFVYSGSMLQERFRIFDQAFRSIPHTVCYAVKANANLSVLKLLASLGAGFDLVSGGELERVRRTAKSALKRTVFSGVGKTAEEIDTALASDILLFNVESASELRKLSERATAARKKARIAMRVNPDVFARTHPYISTGLREHKFGVSIADAPVRYAWAAQHPWLEPCGVSVHIGSQITDVGPFNSALKRVAKLVRELRKAGHDIRFVDAGGGLGIGYKDSDSQRMDFREHAAAYARAVNAALHGLGLHLILEPGRALIAPCGVLLTRALYIKQNGRKRFLIVDAAMNDLIRPALYGAYHSIVPVKQSSGRSTSYDVVGPVCETGDFFARDRKLPESDEGDLFAILDVGAYGMSLSSNYNSRPRAAEVMVDGGNARVIRKRETMRELMSGE